jgi:hypothetical protein
VDSDVLLDPGELVEQQHAMGSESHPEALPEVARLEYPSPTLPRKRRGIALE